MQSLLDLISSIEARPGLYLEETAITSLSDLFTGYMLGSDGVDLISQRLANDFNHWLAKKYNDYPTPKGWRMLLLERAGDEEKAFRLFFEEFREFLAS